MSVTQDILATYRGPAAVFGRLLAMGRREDKALMFLLMGCVLVFVSQSPVQARLAYFDDTIPLTARLYWSALFWIFLLPLAFYVLAGGVGLVARVLRQSQSWYGVRLSLFWALLASAPVLLLQGLASGYASDGVLPSIFGLVWLVLFLWFSITGLRVAGKAGA